jgi:hypothetical protein
MAEECTALHTGNLKDLGGSEGVPENQVEGTFHWHTHLETENAEVLIAIGWINIGSSLHWSRTAPKNCSYFMLLRDIA